jgi:hypothetical protein
LDGIECLLWLSNLKVFFPSFLERQMSGFFHPREVIYNLVLSRLMVMVKFFRVISRVAWFNGEQTQRFEDHLCPHSQGCDVAPRGSIPSSSVQHRTRSSDRYRDDGVDPRPRHNPEDEDRDGPRNIEFFHLSTT